jgi:hypothetical protein
MTEGPVVSPDPDQLPEPVADPTPPEVPDAGDEAAALAAADSDEEAADDAPLADPTPPGVLVIRHKDAQGNIFTDAVPVGGVEPDQVLTLLEMGYANYRAKVGLPGR